jgi:eukaryotic-like serine/threonine-protein kinase
MALAPSTQLGPYLIQSQIGAGGMGEVYRARDTRLGRDVALKILPESLSRDSDRLRRFEQEAQAVAALNHPNVVAIFDVGHQNGSPYLVSEFLDGESLRAVLDHGPMPQRKVIEYAVQIANGLAAAHEKGIVHRDLKPDNIFVCRDGRVKILDFGVAKLAAATEPDGATMTNSHTAAGVVLGTASYMAPEQVRGERVDARTDIFSFGAVLFEMASHGRAFQRPTTAETMTAILREDPPEITDVQPPIAPATERIIRRCLEKNPENRFQSAKDLAFGLEALSQISAGSQTAAQRAVETAKPRTRRNLIAVAGAAVLAAAMLGLGWWIGKARSTSSPPQYQQITFRTGTVGNARFTPDDNIVYSATWEDGVQQLYLSRKGDAGATTLGLKNAELLSISKTGELAIRLRPVGHGGYSFSGTLARVPLSGGTPRETLDNVGDADWAADGENMAIVRYIPETSHWRLEYPVGKVLFDSINWISHPKISPDGKSVAFSDHENPIGDDQGSVAVIGPDGREKKLSSGWSSVEGIEWSPSGDEIWFAGSDTGAANQLRGVTLGGKLRTIANVPGGVWLQDMHNGSALMVVNHQRVNIRGTSPGGKEERELGWLGWSELRDISRDGTKILFEEEAEGGGPNYTVFLRDTDGSPPVQLGDGVGGAISPDGKWVVTRPLKTGALSLVPTGAGESRQLTHDNVTYSGVRYFPDGKGLIAEGIEPGHGKRDYRIDISTGASKPITPEGVSGYALSPDARELAVTGPDGNPGIWSFDTNSLRSVPGLDSNDVVSGWTSDGSSLYVTSFQDRLQHSSTKVYRVTVATGKKEFWKEFGTNLPAGTAGAGVGLPRFAAEGSAYAYVYSQVLSEAYVVKGLK